ncbi:MAG: hypothetical protein IPF48_13760 [Sphingomonadales bacterium]|nr:hypothetical protein [Sphingomonadales bacterium]
MLRDFPENSHYFSQQFVAVGKRKLSNRNSLIRQMPEADGMKTGFVCNSGFNLVATATRSGRKLGAVIFGANSGKHRADLAEMLLVDGFTRPDGPHAKIASLTNMKTGAVVPADMTKTVCKQKPVTIASSKDLSGWGISFGNYESSETADMALRGRLLSKPGSCSRHAGPDPPARKSGLCRRGVELDQQKSLSTCAEYRKRQRALRSPHAADLCPDCCSHA